MRAVGFYESLPIEDERSLVDVEIARPVPSGRQLLVEVRAVSVNPVDTKVRARGASTDGTPKILGYDAAGVVVETGPEATLFKPGDAVFYAGAIDKPGTNSEFHLVDERIVGPKPATLDFDAAAALPLTSITAYEALFDRLLVKHVPGGTAPILLIVGGAGGVGSIAIQLARRLTDLTIVATASRPETADWCRELGAHHVIDHAKPLAAEYAALGLDKPAFVFSTTQTDKHFAELAEIIAPQGRFALIDDPGPIDVSLLKRKSASLHWEFMFTRSLFGTPDIEAQHRLLKEVSHLVDQGAIRSTLTEVFGPIDAANLRRAHSFIESGKARGKVVLAGF